MWTRRFGYGYVAYIVCGRPGTLHFFLGCQVHRADGERTDIDYIQQDLAENRTCALISNKILSLEM